MPVPRYWHRGFPSISTVRATYNTTLRSSPMQLVFGRNAILNIKHVTNWEHICHKKEAHINKNNIRKNSCRIAYEYTLSQKILLKCKKASKHEQELKGPDEITDVDDNGTDQFQKGKVNDVTNICRIKPFIE